MNYLITGGAGSIGSALTAELCQLISTKKVIAVDNNEHNLSCLPPHEKLKIAVGDVRDKTRIQELLNNINIVVHAASLKRVELTELNVNEAVKTNVYGTINVAEACRSQHARLLLISSDKAVPQNDYSLYGATKYLQEKIVLAANGSVARFGNVMNTHGDVLEIWAKQAATGQPLTITDPRMKRFFWSLPAAVTFILHCLNIMEGGEIFVPKMQETTITEFQRQHYPDMETRVIGMRPGEMLHHSLLTPTEQLNATEHHWGWIIK